MCTQFFRNLIFICLAVVAASGKASEIDSSPGKPSGLQMVVTNIAPWGTLSNGQAKGLHVDLLRDVGREWGGAYQLKVMPYARTARAVELGIADLSILFDSPSSLEAGHRILALPKVDVIVVMHDDLELDDLQRRDDLKVGRLRLGFYGRHSLPVKDEQWVTVNSIAQGVGMLRRERLHMLVTTAPAYKYALQQLQIESVEGVRAQYINSIRGSIFLSRLSSLDKNQVKAAAERAMVRHWEQLQSISQLHSAGNVIKKSSVDFLGPVLAAR